MNPTLHVPSDIRLGPTTVNGVLGAEEDLFTLRIQYVCGGGWQVFHSVHVPKALQGAISNGKVESVHLETVISNSVAERSLPGSPSYLVLGVRIKEGPELQYVPAKLRASRAAYLALGLVACASAVALLGAYAWAGALLLVAGTHAIRTAHGIPTRPFLVVRRCIA